VFEWLERNRNIKWWLPVCCVMLAAMVASHLYRRARWTGPIWRAPTFLGAVQRVVWVCIGLYLVSVVTMVTVMKGG
jgi:hypothetical protein